MQNCVSKKNGASHKVNPVPVGQDAGVADNFSLAELTHLLLMCTPKMQGVEFQTHCSREHPVVAASRRLGFCLSECVDPLSFLFPSLLESERDAVEKKCWS